MTDTAYSSSLHKLLLSKHLPKGETPLSLGTQLCGCPAPGKGTILHIPFCLQGLDNGMQGDTLGSRGALACQPVSQKLSLLSHPPRILLRNLNWEILSPSSHTQLQCLHLHSQDVNKQKEERGDVSRIMGEAKGNSLHFSGLLRWHK